MKWVFNMKKFNIDVNKWNVVIVILFSVRGIVDLDNWYLYLVEKLMEWSYYLFDYDIWYMSNWKCLIYGKWKDINRKCLIYD